MEEHPMSELSPAPAPNGTSSTRRGLLVRYWWVVGLAIAGAIAILAANFASGDPDGLDSVAIEKGFETTAQEPGFRILPDYTIPGLDGTASTVVAGIVGVAIVFLVVFVVGRLLARRRKRTGELS
jgi:cobalt/nickel transport system permease protein